MLVTLRVQSLNRKEISPNVNMERENIQFCWIKELINPDFSFNYAESTVTKRKTEKLPTELPTARQGKYQLSSIILRKQKRYLRVNAVGMDDIKKKFSVLLHKENVVYICAQNLHVAFYRYWYINNIKKFPMLCM